MWPFAKRWLEQVAWFYPAVFCAGSFYLGLPQFLTSLLPGMELTRSEVSLFAWMTGSMATNVIAPSDPQQLAAILITTGLAFLAALGLRYLNTTLSGMTLSLYGIALCQSLIFATLGGNRKPTLEQAIPALLGFVCMTVGFTWLLNGFPSNRRPARFLWLCLGLLIPVALVATQFARGPRRTTWKFFALELALPLVASILASFKQQAQSSFPAIDKILIGLGVSALLLGSTSYLGKRQFAAKELVRESQLAVFPETPVEPYEMAFFQKGISFTAEFPVPYGEPNSQRMLASLPQFGVNSIALIPYGRLRRDRSLESDIGLEMLTRQAHKQGMKVMLKPHSRKPSEKDLPNPEAVATWFRNHQTFILEYAKFAQKTHADLFCVGTEFGWLSKFEPQWRFLIAEVRKVYAGPLVYAPNHGPEFENVQFWDALDYIGIDNYYPLTDSYSALDVLASVEKVQQRFQKPVLFTEAGFSAAEGAHKEPWADETNYPLSLKEQERCYEALLQTFYHKPWFHGFYWWKVGTNGYGGEKNNSMTPWRKPAMELLKRYYTSPAR